MRIRCVWSKPGKQWTASCFALISAMCYSLDLHTLDRLEQLWFRTIIHKTTQAYLGKTPPLNSKPAAMGMLLFLHSLICWIHSALIFSDFWHCMVIMKNVFTILSLGFLLYNSWQIQCSCMCANLTPIAAHG